MYFWGLNQKLLRVVPPTAKYLGHGHYADYKDHPILSIAPEVLGPMYLCHGTEMRWASWPPFLEWWLGECAEKIEGFSDLFDFTNGVLSSKVVGPPNIGLSSESYNHVFYPDGVVALGAPVPEIVGMRGTEVSGGTSLKYSH